MQIWDKQMHGSSWGANTPPRRVVTFERSAPLIVCLCGSSRFRAEYEHHADRLTHDGAIIVTIHCFKGQHSEVPGMDEAVRGSLDELHKRKIDLADRVFVINVGGYVGDSTRSEIAYARAKGKPVEFLEPETEA
jgi:hypothetical protein